MIACFYGEQKLAPNTFPKSNLNSNLLIQQVEITNQLILTESDIVKINVCDRTPTNQAFFKLYETAKKKWKNPG